MDADIKRIALMRHNSIIKNFLKNLLKWSNSKASKSNAKALSISFFKKKKKKNAHKLSKLKHKPTMHAMMQ